MRLTSGAVWENTSQCVESRGTPHWRWCTRGSLLPMIGLAMISLVAHASCAPCTAPRLGSEALGQLVRHLYGSLDRACWLSIAASGHPWALPGRGRAKSRRHERLRPCFRCQRSRQSSNSFSGRVLLASSTCRANGAGIWSGFFPRHRQFRLGGSPGHRFVDLWHGCKVVSMLCVACGTCGGRVARRPLLGACPGALTLHDGLLCFVPGSNTLRGWIVYLGKFHVPGLSMLHQGTISPCPWSYPCLSSVAWRVDALAASNRAPSSSFFISTPPSLSRATRSRVSFSARPCVCWSPGDVVRQCSSCGIFSYGVGRNQHREH